MSRWVIWAKAVLGIVAWVCGGAAAVALGMWVIPQAGLLLGIKVSVYVVPVVALIAAVLLVYLHAKSDDWVLRWIGAPAVICLCLGLAGLRLVEAGRHEGETGLVAAERAATQARADAATAVSRLKQAESRIAELEAARAPQGAAPVAVVSAPVSKPKVKVRKAVKPTAPVEGGWMGAVVKAVTGG